MTSKKPYVTPQLRRLGLLRRLTRFTFLAPWKLPR
jgi:hypothetical protein